MFGAASATSTSAQPTSSSPSGASSENGDSSSSNTGAIVGGVIGGVAAIVIVAILAIWSYRRRRNRGGSGSGSKSRGRLLGTTRTKSFYEMDPSHELQKPNEVDGLPLAELRASTKPAPRGNCHEGLINMSACSAVYWGDGAWVLFCIARMGQLKDGFNECSFQWRSVDGTGRLVLLTFLKLENCLSTFQSSKSLARDSCW